MSKTAAATAKRPPVDERQDIRVIQDLAPLGAGQDIPYALPADSVFDYFYLHVHATLTTAGAGGAGGVPCPFGAYGLAQRIGILNAGRVATLKDMPGFMYAWKEMERIGTSLEFANPLAIVGTADTVTAYDVIYPVRFVLKGLGAKKSTQFVTRGIKPILQVQWATAEQMLQGGAYGSKVLTIDWCRLLSHEQPAMAANYGQRAAFVEVRTGTREYPTLIAGTVLPNVQLVQDGLQPELWVIALDSNNAYPYAQIDGLVDRMRVKADNDKYFYDRRSAYALQRLGAAIQAKDVIRAAFYRLKMADKARFAPAAWLQNTWELEITPAAADLGIRFDVYGDKIVG